MRTALAVLLSAGLAAFVPAGVSPRAELPPPPTVQLPELPVMVGPISRTHEPVTLGRDAEGRWRLYVNGEPFEIHGAGGAVKPGLLEQLKAAGGNCVRTWSTDTLETPVADGERFIDRAHRLGIKVVPGIWVQHERHGFDYRDPAFLEQQRRRVVESVRKYKDHPAVLAWGLGNEMEGPASRTGSVTVFREVEHLAQRVKEEDPHHPVMTIIAFNGEKAKNVMRHCPSIDILGVNSYGGAAGAGGVLKSIGWTKPFAVTEFGVRGFWEVPATPWGAPLEPNSQEKARTFYATHRMVHDLNDGKELCLGTFAFLWGWKQERTSTWFGMFLPTLEKLPQVDAMTKAWSGEWPENRCPKILSVTSDAAAQTLEPGRTVSANVAVVDPDGDDLAYRWRLFAESTASSEGGDAEAAPPEFPGYVEHADQATCLLTGPDQPGAYRLFLTVHDGRGGAATANFPFLVKE